MLLKVAARAIKSSVYRQLAKCQYIMSDFAMRSMVSGRGLDFRQNGLLDLPDLDLVALIEGPLFDPLGTSQSGMAQYFHVFAGGRLAHAKLARDQAPAYPILHQIAIDLRREMLCRFLKPLEDL